MVSLGKRIKQERFQQGLTQEAVAEAIGVSRTAVSKWESGESEPTIQNLVALSRLFDVGVDSLLGVERHQYSQCPEFPPEAMDFLKKFVSTVIETDKLREDT